MVKVKTIGRGTFLARRCQGSIMLLVMVAVAITTVISLTFMTSATTITGISKMVDHHAQARQVAESGLQLGKSYLEREPAWREDQVNGVWASEFPLLDGKVSLQASFEASPPVTPLNVSNASFESGTGSLSNGILGLVFPTMSGTVGGWRVERNCLTGGITSLTVPHVGVINSGTATDGGKLMRARFAVGVSAVAAFSRTLGGVELDPLTTYTLEADVINVSLATVMPVYTLTVKVGGVVVATASGADLLNLLDINAQSSTEALRFTTNDAPPAGNVTIELSCSVLVGALQTIGFDNVKFEKVRPMPVLLTATATHGDAGHVVSAMVLPMGNTVPAKIMAWTDP